MVQGILFWVSGQPRIADDANAQVNSTVSPMTIRQTGELYREKTLF